MSEPEIFSDDKQNGIPQSLLEELRKGLQENDEEIKFKDPKERLQEQINSILDLVKKSSKEYTLRLGLFYPTLYFSSNGLKIVFDNKEITFDDFYNMLNTPIKLVYVNHVLRLFEDKLKRELSNNSRGKVYLPF